MDRDELEAIALEVQPVDLSVGSPDFAPPPLLTRDLQEVADGHNIALNQYTKGFVSTCVIGLFAYFLSYLIISVYMRQVLRTTLVHECCQIKKLVPNQRCQSKMEYKVKLSWKPCPWVRLGVL